MTALWYAEMRVVDELVSGDIAIAGKLSINDDPKESYITRRLLRSKEVKKLCSNDKISKK